MIKAADLIKKFQYALDNSWGYIYGMTHEAWTAAKQEAYAKKYADDFDRQASVKYGGKWDGHWVTDCSGLFKWAFRELGGDIAHGSNSIWDNWCSQKGDLKNGYDENYSTILPGVAVFTVAEDGRHNHIGLYAGHGIVIEAANTQDGVTTSAVFNSKWKAWGLLKNVYYNNGEKEDDPMTATVVLPAGAKGNTVNLRSRPVAGSTVLTRVPVGATVTVVDDFGTWMCVQYEGKEGYMMSNYLEYAGQGGEANDAESIDISQIEDDLKKIDELTEHIRSVLGRG